MGRAAAPVRRRRGAGSVADVPQVPKSRQKPTPECPPADAVSWSANLRGSASRTGHDRPQWPPEDGLCRPDRWCPRRYYCGMWPWDYECCRESAAGRRGRRRLGRSPPGAGSRLGRFAWGRQRSAPARCHRSSMLPMLYPTLPRPAGSIPRRATIGFVLDKSARAAASRRRSAGAVTPPGPNRSRWSKDKENPRRAIRIQTGQHERRLLCAGVGRRTRYWLLLR